MEPKHNRSRKARYFSWTFHATSPPCPYLFLRVVQRESTPAGEVRADGMVVHHHRERTMHSDVRVHQAFELLRVVVALVPRDDESSTIHGIWSGFQDRAHSKPATSVSSEYICGELQTNVVPGYACYFT